MSTKWSLGHLFKTVSYAQFIDLTEKFINSCEESVGPCSLRIHFLDAHKNDIKLNAAPAHLTEFRLESGIPCQNSAVEDLNDATKSLWEDAMGVEVYVAPIDQQAHPFTWAEIGFKGAEPQEAVYTFHNIPDDTFLSSVPDHMILKKHPQPKI